tara:strand:+ start:1240 stop:1716 length:477 start_codon:yes stop_codon:yes gene_type:complete
MKKTIKVDFFCQSKKWPRRLPKVKKITLKTLKKMSKYFKNNHLFRINLILSDKKKMIKLNQKFKNKYQDTDVLTFVSKINNKELGKISYCDIFFSIDTIENFISKNNVSLYDHYNHLLIHSILHINGYKHKNIKQFNTMKKEEIKILNKMKITNPYIL